MWLNQSEMAFLVAALTSIFLAGCVTTANYDKVLRGYVGRSADQLVKNWGPPDQTSPSTDGGKTLTYYHAGGSIGSKYNYGNGPYSSYNTIISCRTMFTVDSSNTVTNWQHDDSNACRSRAPLND